MSKDELKGFKISDQVQRRVDRPAGGKAGAASGEVESVGFPRVEAFVGSESPDFTRFAASMKKLQELLESGSMKEKAGAKKAAVAYERASDLLEHLLSVKASMSGGGAGS